MFFVNPDAKLYRNVPPLALAYAATQAGVRVIDQNTRPLPKDRYLEQKTDELVIFVRSVSFKESKRVAGLYKKKYPRTLIKSLNSPIDVQCCYPTLQFPSQLKIDKQFGDDYSFPDFSLFDSYDVWLSHWQDGSWPYGILTSVGCPFQCTYCAARNRGWKSRSAKNCVEELRQAKNKYRIVSFEILDDAFNVDKKRVLEFCRLVRPLNLNWSCANGLRADLLDEDVAKSMAESGCRSVSFGIESVDPQVLINIKKGETIEQIGKAIDIANKYFKSVNGFFIIGLPGSSYEKDLKSVEWAIKKRITGVFSYHVPKEKELKSDDMFYGERAHPQSNEYPKVFQKKIYEMTAFMREPTTPYNFIFKAFNLLSLIYRFDRSKILNAALTYFHKTK